MDKSYYGRRQADAQRRGQTGSGGGMDIINTDDNGTQQGDHASAMSNLTMTDVPDSLDDIIRQNSHELHQRRSVVRAYNSQMRQDGERRVPMMNYGTNEFRNFSYFNMGPPVHSMSDAYGGMAGPVNNMDDNMDMQAHAGNSSRSLMMDMGNQANMQGYDLDMMMAYQNMDMGQLASPNMDLFSPTLETQFPPTSMTPVQADYGVDMGNDPLSACSTTAHGALDHNTNVEMMADSVFGRSDSGTPQRPRSALGVDPSQTSLQTTMPPSLPQADTLSNKSPSYKLPSTENSLTSAGALQTTMAGQKTKLVTPVLSSAPSRVAGPRKEKTVYSKSGFDMLRAFFHVMNRKNPKVQVGAVDLSCAFVVCDITLNDCPIIYVSDNFQNLTGYSRHEIIGQNCRFLQSPDGKVEAGTKREFVEDDAVYYIKKMVAEGQEVQQSLINYRRNGVPFLNMLTMIPIPWDESPAIRYFIGFQIDLVECPDAVTGNDRGGFMQINYKTGCDVRRCIWTLPKSNQWEPDSGQTLGVDDVSTLLQQFNAKGGGSDWHRQSWDKMLLENADDVVHVLSLKGVFLYLSPACKKALEYDPRELLDHPITMICHPSDHVPVTREIKNSPNGNIVNLIFRVRRKYSGYTWFESYGSLFVEQGKGRKCVILVGRNRPVFALQRRTLEAHGGVGDSEFWTKISTSGMFLFVSSNVRSLLDLLPEKLEGTSMQELMRKESRVEFGRAVEKARRGKIVTVKHEVQNKRGQVLQAQTILYPGDANEGEKPTFLLAQTKLLRATSRSMGLGGGSAQAASLSTTKSLASTNASSSQLFASNGAESKTDTATPATTGGSLLALGSQDFALAADDNIFDELKTTRCMSWQYELAYMGKKNKTKAEELAQLLSSKKKRKRRKGSGNMSRDCANCHTRNTPEWRRGPSGNRDLCNSCGLRWAKQTGRVSPRTSSRGGNGDSGSKLSNSPVASSPLNREFGNGTPASQDGGAAMAADVGNESGIVTGADKTPSPAQHLNPPQSQPLLEGGSGLGGMGMEMTSIKEEREQIV